MRRDDFQELIDGVDNLYVGMQDAVAEASSRQTHIDALVKRIAQIEAMQERITDTRSVPFLAACPHKRVIWPGSRAIERQGVIMLSTNRT